MQEQNRDNIKFDGTQARLPKTKIKRDGKKMLSKNQAGATTAITLITAGILAVLLLTQTATIPPLTETPYETKANKQGQYIDLAGDANFTEIVLNDQNPTDLSTLRAWNTKAFQIPEKNETKWRVYQKRVHFFDGEKWIDLNRISFPAIEKKEFLLEEKPPSTNTKTIIKSPNPPFVCFNQNCISVEVALSQQEIASGLMFREQLAQNAGMLITFPQQAPCPIWMRNIQIPLDIIWMNADKKVVFIKENALPCEANECETFTPNEDAKFALEVNAGFVEENKITPEEKAEFRNIPQKQFKTQKISTTRFKIDNYLLHKGITASITETNEIVFKDAKQAEIKKIASAYAIDSKQDLITGHYLLLQKQQELEIFVDISSEWLQNAEYPITIDPDTNYAGSKADGYLQKGTGGSPCDYTPTRDTIPSSHTTETLIYIGQQLWGI